MKKSMLLGMLLLTAMIFVLCGKSPEDKLVGKWEVVNEGLIVVFNEDSTFPASDGDKGTWKMNDEETSNFLSYHH